MFVVTVGLDFPVLLQFTYYIDEQYILDDLMIINKVCGGKTSFTKSSPAQASQLNTSTANENAHEVSIEDGRLSYDKRWQVEANDLKCH